MCGNAAAHRAETRRRTLRRELLAARSAAQVLALRCSGFRPSLDVDQSIRGSLALVRAVRRPKTSLCNVEAALAVAALIGDWPLGARHFNRVWRFKAPAPRPPFPSAVFVLRLLQQLHQRSPHLRDRLQAILVLPHTVGWQRGDATPFGEADFVPVDGLLAHGNCNGSRPRGDINR